ncbi:hypothetical protein LZ31DRAFT_229916 [Colletotrichum somersetense]|nr:hypothetical protein LZ31DRAFT_229916 [Colletotrichum somersetense]
MVCYCAYTTLTMYVGSLGGFEVFCSRNSDNPTRTLVAKAYLYNRYHAQAPWPPQNPRRITAPTYLPSFTILPCRADIHTGTPWQVWTDPQLNSSPPQNCAVPNPCLLSKQCTDTYCPIVCTSYTRRPDSRSSPCRALSCSTTIADGRRLNHQHQAVDLQGIYDVIWLRACRSDPLGLSLFVPDCFHANLGRRATRCSLTGF